MTYIEAKKLYIERFGGFPEFLFMGADEDEILPHIQKALKTGKEIEVPDEEMTY